MNLAEASVLADEAIIELSMTADALAAVLADEQIDRDDTYVALCERLGLELIEPTRSDVGYASAGRCDVCGVSGLAWLAHSRWHLRLQAVTRFAQHQSSLGSKTTMILGAVLSALFTPEDNA